MTSLKPLQSLRLDGRGGAQPLAPEDIDERTPGQVQWLHLDYEDPASVDWLRTKSGIAEVYVDALIVEDPRPRSLVDGDSLLVVSRGVNLNSGADPEDMVSLRLWIEADRVLTLRHRRLASVQEVVDKLAAIFLPLGLLTGLLGINVGGIPGTQSRFAFTFVTISLFVIAGFLWSWFKRRSVV